MLDVFLDDKYMFHAYLKQVKALKDNYLNNFYWA